MDLAPLIDVVFQLLVFFMLTSAFANPAIKMTLPKGSTDDKVDSKIIEISVDSNLSIYLNDQEISKDKLLTRLNVLLKNQEQNSVNIKGDEAMPYALFVEIMDLARQAGAAQLNIIHQK